jgi:glutaredoxin 3
MKVKVYSTESCPWCHKAKDFLKENKVKFDDIRVDQDSNARDEMIEKSGQMGVPVIEINDSVIVGFDIERIKSLLNL